VKRSRSARRASSPAVRALSLLMPGSFTDDDPYRGLESTLRLFEYGERLGFDGAWIRQQHLVPNVSSAAVFLAAASQRTRRIELGTAVIPIGYESPFRLAEGLSMADVLSRGRLQAGFSAGVPTNSELLAGLVYDGDWRSYDFSHDRIARLAANLRGEFLGDAGIVVQHPTGPQRPRLRPHAPGPAQRLWYGAGSLGSVVWAAEHGLHLVVGNICAGKGLGTDDFGTAQLAQLRAYRQKFTGPGRPRVIAGRVILPLDGADAATRRRYREYQASRHQRTLAPIGERRILIAPAWSVPRRRSSSRCAPTRCSRRSPSFSWNCRTPSRTKSTSRSCPMRSHRSPRGSAGQPNHSLASSS
jgi:alkanesulfonate monooxygenase SsuD/methylene tetrahydromethanopterin reductase-like flavin-dependent oxidoreductase (luciferase family)